MKERIKGLIAGLLAGVLLTTSGALASSGAIQKNLWYKDIKIELDGKTLTPQDANGNNVEPFTIDGTTYLPVRAISNALGLEVDWNGSTNTVLLSTGGNAKNEAKDGVETVTVSGSVDAATQEVANIVTAQGEKADVVGYRVIDGVPWKYDSFDLSMLDKLVIGGFEWDTSSLEVKELHNWSETKYAHSVNLKSDNDNNGRVVAVITYDDNFAAANACYWSGEPWDTIAFNQKGVYLINGIIKTSEISFSYEAAIGGKTENTVEAVKNNTLDVGVFARGICIGDSITEGVINTNDADDSEAVRNERNAKELPTVVNGQVVLKQYSYPTQFTKYTGVPVYNAGIAGIRSFEWLDAADDAWNTYWGSWRTADEGWAWNKNRENTLNLKGYDFAVIHLGINDILMQGETPAETTVATFVKSTNEIIARLKSENKGIKVFLCTIIPSYSGGGGDWDLLNDAIRKTANETDDVYLVDLADTSKCAAGTAYSNIHLTALGYRQMAVEIADIISDIIRNNPEEFANVQFIGDYMNK